MFQPVFVNEQQDRERERQTVYSQAGQLQSNQSFTVKHINAHIYGGITYMMVLLRVGIMQNIINK